MPDGIENPVVIKHSDAQKYLLDGVSGLCCFENPLPDHAGNYVLGARDYIDVNVYDYDLISHKALLREEYAEKLGIHPVFCTNLWQFTEFLYGSLPEMEVTPLAPTPTDPPTPTGPPDVPDDLVDLGSVKIGTDENGSLVNECTVYVGGGVLTYETKNADFMSNAEPDGLDYIRHAVIEDYCPKFIGRFTLNVDVDGYVSMMFPDLYLNPEMVKPEEYTPMDSDRVMFPTTSGVPEIALLSEWSEPIVVLYADGKKYYVSPYGGNVRIPVNKGENIVLLEIGLQVKDEFLSNHEGYIQAVYQCFLEDFAVYIREYNDSVTSAVEDIKDTLENQLEESKKQTDALTKYEGADKMQSDNDKLSGAIKDYDDVNDSLFESAGEGIGNFDITTGLTFNGKLLASIGFLSTVITNIILAMGDFSVLYTVGVCLVLACILIGLFKYFGGDG